MVTVRAEIDAQEWTRILATVEKSSNDKSMNESLANTVGPEANTLGKVEQETTKGRGIETTKGGITERPTVRSKVVLLMHVSPLQRQGFFCPSYQVGSLWRDFLISRGSYTTSGIKTTRAAGSTGFHSSRADAAGGTLYAI